MKKFKFLLTFIVFTAFAFSVHAQLSNYNFGQNIETYTEISGGILLGNESTDDEVFVDPANPGGQSVPEGGPGFPIGFNFTFNGTVFNRLGVNANGWIALGSDSFFPAVGLTSTYPFQPLASTINFLHPEWVSRIAGLTADLLAQPGASIRLQTIGEAPNRICVVQWKNYRPYLNGNGDSFNFQIRLHETSNTVSIVYGNMVKNSGSMQASVGMRAAPANVVTNYAVRTTQTNWQATQAGATVDEFCLVSPSVIPPAGLTFSYSPSAGNMPPNCALMFAPANGATNLLNNIQLAWGNGGENPTGYRLYLGTDNPPTNLMNGIDLGNTTTYSPGLLEYSTTYYWKVVAYNQFGDAADCPVWSFTLMDNPAFVTFPFIESFEVGNVNGSSDIFMWTQELIGNTDEYWEANTTFPNFRAPRTGNFNIILYLSGHTWLFRPFYFTGGVNYDIELWARQSSANYNSNVGIYRGLQPNGDAMTTTIAAQQAVTNGEYQKVSGSFSVEESGIFYIGIRGLSSNTFFHLSLDDILISEADFCYQPSELNVTNLTSKSALLNWTQIGGATSWNIEWGEAGFVQGTGNMIQSAPNNSYHLSGLELGTTYDFYVQAVCDANNLSEWSSPGSFTTKSCNEEDECEYTFVLLDNFGDGWNGATMQVISGGSVVKVLGTNFTTGDDFTEYHSFCHNTGFEVFFNNGGGYPQEVGLKILDFMGEIIFLSQGYDALEAGTIVFEGTANCLLPDCLKPIDLNAINISPSGADLLWTALNGETTWNLEWGLLGFNPGTGTLLESIASNPYSLGNLSEGTHYSFYVQAVCDGGTSDWAGPFSFFTSYNICESFSLPLFEDFEGETFPPTCWKRYDYDGAIYPWQSSNVINHTPTGAKAAWHRYSNQQNQDGWLVMPKMALADYTIFQLNFWSFNAYQSDYGKNSVLVSTGSPVPANGDFVEIWNAQSVSNNWEETDIALDDFAGQEIFIAFRYEGLGAHSWFLDDVHVYPLTAGSLEGAVTSALNIPIEGAKITAGDYVAYTNQNGYYQIPVMIAGTYTLICEAEGFFTNSAFGIEIETDQTTTLDFALDFSQISINPGSLTEQLQSGENSVQQLVVSNPQGTANLQWQAYFIYQDNNKTLNNIEYPVLWDNTQIQLSTAGLTSMELTGLVPDGRIISADDFIIPAQEVWEIRYVYTQGFSLLDVLPDAFKVAFYQDKNGTPGDLIYVEEVVPQDLNFDTQRLYLNNSLVLPEGHFWLSVYAVFEGATNPLQARWNWSTGSLGVSNHTKTNDYAGLFGLPGWKNADTYPSLFFKIGGYVNSWLSLSANGGTVQPGQSQVIDVEFNTANISDGEYSAEIHFVHNGQVANKTNPVVSVSLTVANTAPPEAPFDPTPAHLSTMIALQPLFQWKNGNGTSESKIRIEQIAFPNNILVYESGFFVGNSFPLATAQIMLAAKEDYRWMVTCKNNLGETTGDWWHFESIGQGAVSGFINDAYSGDALPGVLIKLNNEYQTLTLASGTYSLTDVTEGLYEITASLEGYLSQSKMIQISHGMTETIDFSLSQKLKPPYALKAEVNNIFDVALTWKSPDSGSEEWFFYHDGTFENAFASENGMFGLAQLFTPEEYPCEITKVRYFNDGFGQYQEQMRVYVLTGNGASILSGPHFVTNGPANDWVTVDVNPVTIQSGNFMVATINSNPGGPLVGVDNSLYNGTLFYGSIGNYTELGALGFEYVGSHEAFVTYGSGENKVLNSLASKPENANKSTFAANMPLMSERATAGQTLSKEKENLLGYNIYRNGDFLIHLQKTEFDDFNLDAGNYIYTVTAVYQEGESGHSLPAEAGILLPPALLTAEQQGSVVHVEWESRFYGLENNPFDRFFVLFRNGEKLGEFTVTTYSDNDIVPGGVYCYTVLEVVTEQYETGLSNEICVHIPVYGILTNNPASLSEKHTNGISLTSQALMLTNSGTEPVDFDIEKEYLPDSKTSNFKSSGFCTNNLYSFGCDDEDGILQWELANVAVFVPCEGSPSWYQDFTNLTHYLEPGGTYQLKIMARTWDTHFSVWIDFDDNKTLTHTEVIINAHIQLDYTWYTYDITIPEDAPIGTYGMRMRSRSGQPVNSPCEKYSWGNCADFSVAIGQPWLDVSPKAGTIQPGESVVIDVQFSSELLEEGVFNANLKVNTNNPFMPQPELTIPVQLTVANGTTQEIALAEGWNGWSSFVNPQDDNMFAHVVSPVANDMIISQYFNQLFYPQFGINTMGTFSNQHGYISKMSQPATLIVAGEMAETTIGLEKGWNLMPVLSSCNLDAAEIFNALPALIIAFEVAGNGIWFPDAEIYTLQTLMPGKAYWVKMDAATEITFPICAGNAKSNMHATLRHHNITPWNDVTYTGSSHIAVFDGFATPNFQQGDVVGAFTADDRCAGMATVEGNTVSMALFANDITTKSKDGFSEGELLSFKLFRPSENTEYKMEVSFSSSHNESNGTFAANGLSVISDAKVLVTGMSTQGLETISVYPNPSGGIFNIAAKNLIGEVDFLITDAKGQTVAKGNLNGHHYIDLSSRPAGFYYLRLTGQNISHTQKLIIQ